MRCTNCGWENPEGAQRCEKCNSPLVGAPVYEPKAEEPQTKMKSTVREPLDSFELKQEKGHNNYYFNWSNSCNDSRIFHF